MPAARPNRLKAVCRGAVLIGMTTLLSLCTVLQRWLTRDPAHKPRVTAWWTERWANMVCWVLNVRVAVSGPTPPRGSLLAPNHLGYLDVPVLGLAGQGCLFLSKTGGKHKTLGLRFFESTGHMTIDRSSRMAVRDALNGIAERLAHGERVCVFLEGTSSGGDDVLPFHPSMAQAAVRGGAPLVPVAIRYVPDYDGVDVSQDLAFWSEAHEFGAHFWRLLGLADCTAVVRFGEPISSRNKDRKQLVTTAHSRVRTLLRAA